jgi:hypothetical protein
MELENLILNEVARSESQKRHVFSHLQNTDLIQTQQYYEKQVTGRGDHIREGYSKRRKLRR